MSQRGLKNYDSFELLTRALMKDFPDTTLGGRRAEQPGHLLHSWKNPTPRSKRSCASSTRYPKGRYTERAAWKAGWFAYRAGNMREAAGYFESGASVFARR